MLRIINIDGNRVNESYDPGTKPQVSVNESTVSKPEGSISGQERDLDVKVAGRLEVMLGCRRCSFRLKVLYNSRRILLVTLTSGLHCALPFP